MGRYLITHSLLSSWLYTMKENPNEDVTTKRDPMAEFMQTLRREPTPTNEAMQNGIDFEDLVTAIVRGEYHAQWQGSGQTNPSKYGDGEEMGYHSYHKWYQAAKRIADVVAGGQLQYKARRLVRIGNMDVVLYGRLDALKAGQVIDIKFSGRYERGKFIDSTQHPMYMELIPEATAFTYLISNGTDVWTETYHREETRSIYPIVTDFLAWLKDVGLMDIYMEKWLAK